MTSSSPPPSSPPPAPAGGPKAPQQIFPPTDAEESGSVTATQIRELREEILAELEDDAPQKKPWLAIQVALSALLVVSVAIVAVVWWRESRAVGPAVQPESPKTDSPATPPASPAAPYRGRLAEIDMLSALFQEDPTYDARQALERLQPYTNSLDKPVREKAQQALAPVLERLNSQVRSAVRHVAERATDLADEGNFPEALSLIQEQLRVLPKDIPWAVTRGNSALLALNSRIEKQREQTLAAAFAGLGDALRRSDADAPARLAALLKHPDESFRTNAQELQTKVTQEKARKLAEQQRVEDAARAAWLDFYTKFTAAIVASDFDAAQKLTAVEPASPLLGGGVGAPQAALQTWAAEAAAIRELYEITLAKAADERKPVNLLLRKGRHLQGTLAGVEGRLLRLKISGDAVVGVKIETLSAAALTAILPPKIIQEKKLQPALWALAVCENPAGAEEQLKAAYGAINAPVPAHWLDFFKLQVLGRLEQELARKLDELQRALAGKDPDAVRAALEAAQPAVKAFEQVQPLSSARQALLAEAAKSGGRVAREKLVLQNGVSPTADYAGFVSDQINDYRDNQKKSDVGTQWGLRLGASGGLLRILLRFDGLEAAVGKAAVRSATLELYQIDSSKSAGATVAAYRLKRQWIPDGGSWLSYDAAKSLDWSTAGATGEADIEAKDEARVVLDDRKDAWRSLDVTAYFQDVLTGKAPNHGLLLRVAVNEPDYYVRFYPEGDLDARKDKTLRPRLTLVLDRTVEGEK